MRFQPQNGEFEKLDSLDEAQMRNLSSTKPYHSIKDLRALSYRGMTKIAEVNDIKIIEETADLSGRVSTAVVKIRNPRTHWTGCGASQCENTLENTAFNLAVKKARRNAIRLSFTPAYLRKCLKHFLRK